MKTKSKNKPKRLLSEKTITVKTLGKVREEISKCGIAFTISHIAHKLGLNFYGSRVAIDELLKSGEIKKLKATTRGELFVKSS